jgi:hypothetical protein
MSSPAQTSRSSFWHQHLLFGSDGQLKLETSSKFNRRVIAGVVFMGWALLIFVLTRANL